MSEQTTQDRFELPETGKVVVYNHTTASVDEIVLCLRVHIEPKGSIVLPVAKARELLNRVDFLSIEPVEKRARYCAADVERAKGLPPAALAALVEALMLGQFPRIPEARVSEAAMAKGK